MADMSADMLASDMSADISGPRPTCFSDMSPTCRPTCRQTCRRHKICLSFWPSGRHADIRHSQLRWNLINVTRISYPTGTTVAVQRCKQFGPYQNLLLQLPFHQAILSHCICGFCYQMGRWLRYQHYTTMMHLWCSGYISAQHRGAGNILMRWLGKDSFGPIGWNHNPFPLSCMAKFYPSTTTRHDVGSCYCRPVPPQTFRTISKGLLQMSTAI